MKDIDDERRVAVAEWLREHSIDPNRVPLHTPITATVVAEGRLVVEFVRYVEDEQGRLVLKPDTDELQTTDPITVLVDDPPPGHDPVRSLTWDGHLWIRHLEETHP